MIRLPFLHRPDNGAAIRSAARAMQREGVRRQRAKVRATTDAMRARLGLPPVRWPQ